MTSAAHRELSIPRSPWNTSAWPRAARGGVTLALVSTLVGMAFFLRPAFDTSALPATPLDDAALRNGWTLTRSHYEVDSAGIAARPDDKGRITLNTPGTSINADACASPRLTIRLLDAEGIDTPNAATIVCTLSWTRLGDANRYASIAEFPMHAGGAPQTIAFDNLPLEPGWTGLITSLTWTLDTRGLPLILVEAGAPAAAGSSREKMLWRQWWWRDPLVAHTINTIRAPHVVRHAPAAWLAMAMLVVSLAYVSAACWRKATLRPAILIGLFLAAWLLNDARWALGQQQQLAVDAARFADTGTPELQEAALYPPAVAQMAWIARQQLPPGAIYAVIGGNLSQGDSRLRYLFAPRCVQVNVDPLQPQVALDRAAFVLVLNADRASIDRDNNLIAAGFPTWHIEKVFQTSDGLMILRRVTSP